MSFVDFKDMKLKIQHRQGRQLFFKTGSFYLEM